MLCVFLLSFTHQSSTAFPEATEPVDTTIQPYDDYRHENNQLENKNRLIYDDNAFEEGADLAADNLQTLADAVGSRDAFRSAEYLRNNSDICWLSDAFMKECNTVLRLPRDHAQPSDKNNVDGLDKRTLAIDLHDWKSRHVLSNAAVNDVLEIMQNHFKSSNLPIASVNPLLKKANAPVRNNIVDYVGKDKRTLVIDVCSGDCIAFHGVQKVRGNDVDCSALITCPVCHMHRYSKCSHPDCYDSEYDECSPFQSDPTRYKGHKDRLPIKCVYYRPISTKILSLFKQSLTPGNEQLLKYMEVSSDGHSPNRVTRDGCLIDTCDGEIPKREQRAMKDQYAAVKVWWEAEHPGEELLECSILFTIFYDGMVLFERDSDSIWPMLVSLLNCDPGKRSRLGVGLFLNILHDCKLDSGAERYLQDKIFTEEVKMLEKGCLFTFQHPMQLEKTVTVYVQARCVFAHLDTIAFQSFTKLQGATSKAGCKCRMVKGISRKTTICVTCYPGERRSLGPKHLLRQFSMNLGNPDMAFDEEDFYSGGKATSKAVESLFLAAELKDAFVVGTDTYETGCSTVDLTAVKKLAKLKPTDPSNNLWYNHEFPLLLYQEDLCYPLRDLREQVFFDESHITTANYLEWGGAADANRAEWEAKYWWGGDKPLQNPSFAVNGCNGVNNLLKCTQSMGVRNFTYDIMHVGKNIDGYHNDIITGHRGQNARVRKYCTALNVFSFLKYKKNVLPPWRVVERDVIAMDSICNCFLVPVGYKTQYGLRWPIRRNGQLRAKEHLIMLMSYNYYLYSFTKMKKSYRDYFARYAKDLCRLLSPCLSLEDLEKLILSIHETRCLFEGLFPDSEQVFVHHELIDIAHQLRDLGVARGIQCFNGERSLSTLSSLVARGGLHPSKGILTRYDALENIYSYNLATFFENIGNDGKYTDFALKLCGPSEKVSLTVHELDALLEELIHVVETYHMDKPVEKSNFYRMVIVYKACKVKHKFATAFTLGMWFRAINTRYTDLKGAQATLHHFQGYVSGINFNADSPALTVAQDAIDGVIRLSDLSGIIREIATFVPIMRYTAYVKGIKFNARGRNYREVQPPVMQNKAVNGKMTTVYTPTNPLNDLFTHWHQPDDYSSFCRTKFHRLQNNDYRNIITTDEVAQLNLFYRLDWKSDAYLYGLAVADACIRNTHFDQDRRKYYLEPKPDKYSFNGTRQYICLNNICGTALALSILDSSNKPIVRQTRFHDVSWSKETHNLDIAKFDAEADKIYFIELHPERTDYVYGLLEDDLDHTKLWESTS